MNKEAPVYSIRQPETPSQVECAVCHVSFLAAGPTGYAESEPICDSCLLGRDEQLGMVLALISVVRDFSEDKYPTADEYYKSLHELGAFCNIYNSVAARTGPARMLDARDKKRIHRQFSYPWRSAEIGRRLEDFFMALTTDSTHLFAAERAHAVAYTIRSLGAQYKDDFPLSAFWALCYEIEDLHRVTGWSRSERSLSTEELPNGSDET